MTSLDRLWWAAGGAVLGGIAGFFLSWPAGLMLDVPAEPRIYVSLLAGGIGAVGGAVWAFRYR
jgi:hypothetical protein